METGLNLLSIGSNSEFGSESSLGSIKGETFVLINISRKSLHHGVSFQSLYLWRNHVGVVWKARIYLGKPRDRLH
jgi:hypothetical protein